MIRLWLTFAGILFSVLTLAQTKVSGVVKSSTDQKEMYDASVRILETGEIVNTDRIGYFQFVDVTSGNYTLQVNKVGYNVYEKEVVVTDQKEIDLGEILLEYAPSSVEMGVITLTDDELASDESSAQSSVGLLQSSRDVFARTTAYELGAYWFRTRGLDNKYSDVYFNGVRMNKIDNDRVDFGNWGGLNDVTRYPAETTYGLDPSDYSFGDLNGVTYFDTRPSQMRTGTSFSYSMTNRSYRQRLMLTHNTGLNKKGWGFMASGSRRWAEEGRIDGTFYDAFAYFLGIEKKINNKHTLNLSVMGAPYRRSTSSPNTQEIYDLMGTDYNAYWGYQNGEKRSERVKKNHEPFATLSHHWNINDHSKLTTTLGYQTGKHAASRLNWSQASNPSPIYYRNLPSYGSVTAEEWLTDTDVSQIDWENLYTYNALTSDGHSVYYLVSDVNEDNTFTFNSNYRNQLNDKFTLHANLEYQNTVSDNYRQIDDLLGGSFVVDVDDFADPGQNGYSDESNPNLNAQVDDRIEYSYKMHHSRVNGYVAGNLKLGQFDFTLGAKLSNTSIQREGLFDYYRYDNSKGKSEKHSFTDYGVKLNAKYKLNGRNFLVLNGAYYTNAPTTSDVFPQGRTSNTAIPDLESAKVSSADLSYILRGSKVKARATAFYTQTKDEVDVAFGYLAISSNSSSDYNLFTAEVLTGVDKQYLGSEIAVEAQLTSRLTMSAVASIGQYTYNNNPDLYYFSDEFASEGGYDHRGTSYLNNYKLASSPQQGYSLGFQYRDPHYWWVGATANYLANNYVDLAASRRTEQFVTNPETGMTYPNATEESVRELLKQEKYDDAFMLNVNAGKTFRFGDYYMGISLSVSNVLNNKEYRTGGFEQLRLGNFETASDPTQQVVFGNRYWYDQGLSYFFNVFLRF